MSAPLIGITTYRGQNPAGLPQVAVLEAYVQSVLKAGGIPVLIPLGLPESTLAAMTGRLDGILFTGGGDVDPQHYNGSPHPLVGGVDPDRDRLELYLVRHQVAQNRPFLGICRGLQVINVALGGTLYEDILDQRAQALKHQYVDDLPRDHTVHTVEVQPTSLLAEILQTTQVQVNSLHHQGILQLASQLQATAFAPDGVIEAVELPHTPFGLAVQWHPEWLQDQVEMRRLFQAFVSAAAMHSVRVHHA